LEAFYGRKKRKKGSQVFLRSHLVDVIEAIEVIAGDLLPDEVKRALKIAAEYHDYGKVDARFQTWLRNGDWRAAAFAPKPLAKSGETVLKKQAECGLPESFRHELLSLKFAEKAVDNAFMLRDLALHLIASHHGYCRPFAPVVIDREPQCVSFGDVKLCSKERLEKLPHALDSGVAERFWRLTREYGWWGLAYLEGMLRLADWYASDDEKAEVTE
jgi:CRISPR-associated endonuclease/helicase Cas3